VLPVEAHPSPGRGVADQPLKTHPVDTEFVRESAAVRRADETVRDLQPAQRRKGRQVERAERRLDDPRGWRGRRAVQARETGAQPIPCTDHAARREQRDTEDFRDTNESYCIRISSSVTIHRAATLCVSNSHPMPFYERPPLRAGYSQLMPDAGG
jgi:hypothetical protein